MIPKISIDPVFLSIYFICFYKFEHVSNPVFTTSSLIKQAVLNSRGQNHVKTRVLFFFFQKMNPFWRAARVLNGFRAIDSAYRYYNEAEMQAGFF